MRAGVAACLFAICSFVGEAIGAAGAPAAYAPELRARHAELAGQLAHGPFGIPVVLQSREESHRVRGDVFAVLDHPFATVASALAEPDHWCDILILHLNTKYCRRATNGATTRIEVRVGKKQEQPVHLASLLDFAWIAPVASLNYLRIGMQATDGPYDTRDYELAAEAVPLDERRTFLHMSYSFAYGTSSSLALRLYLATLARDKVGFTVAGRIVPGEEPQYIGGLRGVTERNTMRYYLAIDAYLDSLQAPAQQRAEKRFAAWFDATERFPRQLHEVDREEYLRMKRNEYQRQQALH